MSTVGGQYQVFNNGKLQPAKPIKFCLKFNPPLIAVVYELPSRKKYIHEIAVDLQENMNIETYCDRLCMAENLYLNTEKLKKE